MRQHLRNLSCLLGGGALLLSGLAAGQASTAAGAAAAVRPDWVRHTHVCRGSSRSPGSLAGGSYYRVVVRGACVVNTGPVLVQHSLIITRGSALIAVFGRDRTRLTVGGNLIVERGGTLVMGCERKINITFGHRSPVFPCVDDPHQSRPTLSSHDLVRGNLIAFRPLGVVVHNSAIGGGAKQTGGGGGVSCRVKGIFHLFKSPPYSDYEDNGIRGSLRLTGLRSCWYGALRNRVGGRLISSGVVLADPDGNEVNSNWVHHSIACLRNRPAIQYGDGDGWPNRVGRHAFGQCAFGIILPVPAPQAHLHVKVKHRPISIRWRFR